ncbi:dienelactone hydrolase family protein [Myxococcus sp. K38C18041901]|uniref:dienelactone hydrolase family protein n=1 Tax=Myxococcus guangdongensis TaxID=2906760 RepID=UPI0020A764EB|nr:dienelactone hydrolase family protein [Myxococcus guangdongensis]MCP3062819.1 dienelactone hydrolase family protein [Myxococcus guangdongensis]
MTTEVSLDVDVREVKVRSGHAELGGSLGVPPGARGLVVFAHGSGSSRFSPRNIAVARGLREAGLGTLLFDLLAEDEEAMDLGTGELRFDIPFLARRLIAVTRWARAQPELAGLNLGYFGASTGSAAALMAAALHPGYVQAVVSRGGRPELAGPALARVRAPSLLLVGGQDVDVLEVNQEAFDELLCAKSLVVIPGATHLFEEPGALGAVARRAADWFSRHLDSPEFAARE